VIIPARNEAERLPALLSSLKRQTLRPLEILVVDDHSTDGTADLARGLGATVLQAGPLPEGWKGKTWACQEGARRAAGDLFVFLDADTFLTPSGLARLARSHGRLGGVLSVQPHHEIKRPYENLSAVFNVIQLAASNAFTIFGDRVKQKRLFGPCLVLGRETYAAAGGHEAVKDAVVENFSLSQIFIVKGISLQCFRGGGVLSYRMYPDGFMDLVDGWTRSISAGARGTAAWVMVGIVGWLMGGLGTFRHLALDVLRGNWEHIPWLVIIYGCFALQARRFFSRAGSFSVWAALLYPIPVIVFVLVFLRSGFYRIARRAQFWKGRSVAS
jgi:4,4'-diaponeurosporenoate glycosyltransferase